MWGLLVGPGAHHKAEVDEVHDGPHAPVPVEGGEKVCRHLAGDLLGGALAAPQQLEGKQAGDEDRSPEELVCGRLCSHLERDGRLGRRSHLPRAVLVRLAAVVAAMCPNRGSLPGLSCRS